MGALGRKEEGELRGPLGDGERDLGRDRAGGGHKGLRPTQGPRHPRRTHHYNLPLPSPLYFHPFPLHREVDPFQTCPVWGLWLPVKLI